MKKVVVNSKFAKFLCLSLGLVYMSNAIAGPLLPPKSMLKKGEDDHPIAVGVDFRLRLGSGMDHFFNNSTVDYTSRALEFSPQIWLPLNKSWTVVPSIGIGSYRNTDESSMLKNTYKSMEFSPSCSFLHYCDDPCDDYEFYAGLRAGVDFGSGTKTTDSKLQGSTIVTNTKSSGAFFSGLVGLNYEFTPKISGFLNADVFNFSSHKNIYDTSTSSNYYRSTNLKFLNEVRIGALFDLQ